MFCVCDNGKSKSDHVHKVSSLQVEAMLHIDAGG